MNRELILAVHAAKMDAARIRVAMCTNLDGSLSDLRWYLNWTPREQWLATATLDGRFSAEELIAIAEHMLRTQEDRT